MLFIVAQISGVVAWFLLLISYYRKNTNKILIIQILAIFFYLLNYLFLGAWTGLLVVLLELIRDSLYYKSDKDKYIFLGTIPFYIILFIFAKGDIAQIIPIVASLFEGYTLTKKKFIIVPSAILVYSLWVIYDISVKAYSGVLTDGLIVLSNISILISMIRGYKKVDKFKVINHNTVTIDIFKEINKMDKEIYEKDLLWTLDYQEKLYNKNKDNFIFITYKKNLEGYINFITLNKKDYEKIYNLKNIKKEYEEILIESEGKGDYLLIDSILLKEEYQSNKSVNLFSYHLKKFLKEDEYKGIVAFSVNEFERDVLLASNFIEIKTLEDDSVMYIKKD